MATKKDTDKDAKGKDAKGKDGKDPKVVASATGDAPIVITEELQEELDALTGAQRAAVLMLLLGEQQAAEIIRRGDDAQRAALDARGSARMAGLDEDAQEAAAQAAFDRVAGPEAGW